MSVIALPCERRSSPSPRGCCGSGSRCPRGSASARRRGERRSRPEDGRPPPPHRWSYATASRSAPAHRRRHMYDDRARAHAQQAANSTRSTDYMCTPASAQFIVRSCERRQQNKLTSKNYISVPHICLSHLYVTPMHHTCPSPVCCPTHLSVTYVCHTYASHLCCHPSAAPLTRASHLSSVTPALTCACICPLKASSSLRL